MAGILLNETNYSGGTVDTQLDFSSRNAVQNTAIISQLNKFTYNAVASIEDWGQASTTPYSQGQRFYYRQYGVIHPCEAKVAISVGTTINGTTVQWLDALADMVEANPSGSSSESLSSLKVGNTIYSVGGGSGTVDSIPSFTSTNALQNATILKTIKALAVGVTQEKVETYLQPSTHAYSAGDEFYCMDIDGNSVYLQLYKATSAISVGGTISYLNSVLVDTTPTATRHALDGRTGYYGDIQVLDTPSSAIFSQGEYLSVIDSQYKIHVAKALKNIPTGTTITDTGNDPSVECLPAVYENVQANPSGTATSSLTKLQVGNDIYSVSGGGGTVDTNMSDSSTNALQNSKTFEQLNYFTYGGSPQIETLLQASQHEYAKGDRFYYLYSDLVRPCIAKSAIAIGDTITQLNMQDISPLYDLIPSPKNSPTNAQTLVHFSDGDYYEYTFYGWAAYEYTDFACTIAPNYSQGSPSGHRTLSDIPAGRITSYSVQLLGSVHLSVDGTPQFFAAPIGSTVVIPRSVHADFTDDITVHFWFGADPDDSSKAALFYETDANVTSSHTINMLGWFTVII